MFGITDEGFVSKRLEDIKQEIEESIKTALGVNINLLPSSVLGQIIGIFSERESLIWEQMENVFNSQYPSTASGQVLDLVAQLTGITRLSATRSTADLFMRGTAGVIIPAGSQIARSDDATVIFETTQDATILEGINEIQLISFDEVPDSGSFELSFNGVSTSSLSSNSSSSDVENALNNLPDLSSVLVTGDFSSGFTVLFSGIDGEQPQDQISVSSESLMSGASNVSILITTQTEGQFPSVTVSAQSVELGEVPAPASTLTNILTPVSGWDSSINPLDADLGREEESDSELKLRRDQTLQIAGAATVDAIFASLSNIQGVTAVRVFENNSETADSEGRPAKSYEAVLRGGDEQEIAEIIWDTKPAGIRTVGSISRVIVDTQGFNQTVRFSRPTALPIYLNIQLTTNNNFPASGVTLANEALVNFGNSLGIGEDVIIFPRLICSLNDIPGITDIELQIGTSANPTLSDNIIVDENEISEWDSSRVNVTVL